MLVVKTWSSDIWKETWIEGSGVQPTKVLRKNIPDDYKSPHTEASLAQPRNKGGKCFRSRKKHGLVRTEFRETDGEPMQHLRTRWFHVELGAETWQGFKQRAVWYSHVHSGGISVIAEWKALWLWGAENRESTELEKSRMKTRGRKDKVGYWANLQRTASTCFWATDCGMWGREWAQEGPGCDGSEWFRECKRTNLGAESRLQS